MAHDRKPLWHERVRFQQPDRPGNVGKRTFKCRGLPIREPERRDAIARHGITQPGMGIVARVVEGAEHGRAADRRTLGQVQHAVGVGTARAEGHTLEQDYAVLASSCSGFARLSMRSSPASFFGIVNGITPGMSHSSHILSTVAWKCSTSSSAKCAKRPWRLR